MTKNEADITTLVDNLFREESGKLKAILTRIFGFQHAELMEDIVQDTFLTALRRWSYDSIPDNPPAWLMQVAKNKTLNALKRNSKSLHFDQLNAQLNITGEKETTSSEILDRLFLDREIQDSQLRVLFTCCNPTFSERAQIMLTLKTLSGFSIAEIGRALLMNDEAVKKTLYRTRQAIRSETLAFGVPFLNQVRERIKTVHTVLYLIFNEGYKRTGGDELINRSLCYEASRLAKLLIDTLPNEKDKAVSCALLALFCFNSSRFESRLNADGEMVDIKEQEREEWDGELIKMGFYYLGRARRAHVLSHYHLQAGVASVHCQARSWEETDWETILFYYDKMLEMEDSPIIRINRAIALSNLESPSTGLKALEKVEDEDRVGKYYLLYAAKADMYFRLGNYELASSYYRMAMDLAESRMDKNFIAGKIKECDLKNISRQ